MELLVNDLSFHGQFPDLITFRGAIERLMQIRQIVRHFGRSLHCHRKIAHASITSTILMPQAAQSLTVAQRRALLQWINELGPFWEDVRNHGLEDWLQWNGNIVTDSAVGEAAWCCLHGIDRELVSLIPSNWQFSPVPVEWVSDIGGTQTVHCLNHWDPVTIEAVLQAAPTPVDTWGQLEALVTARCTQIIFAADAFVPLRGYPFHPSAAERLRVLLYTLDRFKTCFDTGGQRTPEGHEIYRNFFTGKKGDGGRGPIFTDSSASEKNEFASEMTFSHPEDANKILFCPWHGKVQTPQLRIHFSGPPCADEPLYIVYVGPKITKR